MRVLQVVSDTDRRGAQVFATDLARALGTLGHEVRTVALAPGSVGGLAVDGRAVDVLGPRWPDLRALRALRTAMGGADVTIAHGSSTGPACALAGGRRPFVYRQISDSRFWAPTRVKRWRVRVALGRARRVVALSEHNRADLVEWIGVPAERITVIPNGVPGERFTPPTADDRSRARTSLGLAPDALVVLCANALVPEKGTDVAVRAVAAIPDAVLVVAGDGPERSRLERLARDLSPDRVHFVGSREDAVPLYHAADLVVLASRGGDAMPATLIEAGLCGLPAVSTTVGAIPEIVVDGVTGVVCEPGDDAAVVEAVRVLLADPAARQRASARAREHCLAHFEIGVVAARWAKVLASVTAGRGRA